MRIDSALKNLWKRIERNIVENQVPTRRPAAQPRPASNDTFTSGTATRHYADIQQPLRGTLGPKMDEATANKVVAALYRGALGREPDAHGIETWVPMVQQGRLGEVVDGIVFSEEFKTRSQDVDVKSLSQSLYQGILGRAADPDGDLGTQVAIGQGHLAHRIYDMLLSPEHAEVLARPPAEPVAPTPTPTTPTIPTPTTPNLPPEPGAPLKTVPMRPEYAAVQVDRNNPEKAILEAATWVRNNKPQYFADDNRNRDVEMMGWVIGILRANGHDAHRVVNHPTLHDGFRYGSDALVLNGLTYDIYRSHGGEGSVPQLLNHGPYTGTLRE